MTVQTPPSVIAQVSEAQWSNQFRQTFLMLGWEGYHTHRSDRSEKGFPDWTLVNVSQKRLIFVELKKESGVLTKDQKHWRDILQSCGYEWYCLKPSQYDLAVEILKGKRGRTNA